MARRIDYLFASGFRSLAKVGLTVAFLVAPLSLAAQAEDKIAEPTGKVILTLKGNIAKTNGKGVARFDRDMLTALGMHKLVTKTLYSKSASEFGGIRMRDLLDHVGAKGDKVEVMAIDDYRSIIPIQDYYDYDVLLVLEKEGKPLTIRTRGPSRLMYPFDQFPELRDKKYGSRLVWQIESITIK